MAHLDVFKEYIAQQKSAESSQKKKATPKKVFKNYASKSSKALSSTRATRAKKADDDEQSDDDEQKDEEDEDDGHNEAAEMNETGKGIQTFMV